MIDYKTTLLMPLTTLAMKANLVEKEPLIQQKWINEDVYQKLLKRNKNNQQFILHDGPPYANGNLHIGHALNKILKDIVVRQKNMDGFYSEFIPGWDTHGLPIESALKQNEKDFETFSTPKKRMLCHAYALEQVAKQLSQFKTLGLLTDFSKTYLTLDPEFELNELKLFKKMISKNLIFQDLKPVFWSWSSKTSLAEAEVEYQDVRSPSVYVSFQIKKGNSLIDENSALVIWTTTPWTIPANLAIAVHPDIEYSLIKFNNKQHVVATNLINEFKNALEISDVQIVKKFLGKEIENITYLNPFNKHEGLVILAEYVSSENGTGLVHNAPGFGMDDYFACKKYGINVYCPIDDDGNYDKSINDSELEGMFYLDANIVIGKRLEETGNLLKLKFIKHSQAHDWRTKKPVIYRATKQWFINIQDIQDNILTTLKNDVKSSNIKTTDRIVEMIKNRKEWCISRQRVWGLPIIIIYDENKKPILDLDLIENIINIIKVEGINVWFEKEATYFLTSKYDKKLTYTKEHDTLDVWFDSGSSFLLLKENNLNYPADLYLEGSDQFRGWFNSSLINGVIDQGKAPYRYLLQHGFVLDHKGFKMSKSVGNVISPAQIINKNGADILRLWVANSDFSSDIKIGPEILKQNSELYRKIRNTLFRYTLSNLNDFDPVKNWQTKLRIEDEYILNLLNLKITEINKAYENYKFIDVIKIINNFTIDLSQWYFDIIKDPLYCLNQDDLIRRQIQTTLYIILNTFLILLTPIIPHTCEDVYSHFNKINKFSSINLEPWIKKIDFELVKINLSDFDKFFDLKNKLFVELEKSRKDGIIKKNNSATVTMKNETIFSTDTLIKWLGIAKFISSDLDEIIITNENLGKCLRCWNYFEDFALDNDSICQRCLKNIN